MTIFIIFEWPHMYVIEGQSLVKNIRATFQRCRWLL